MVLESYSLFLQKEFLTQQPLFVLYLNIFHSVSGCCQDIYPTSLDSGVFNLLFQLSPIFFLLSSSLFSFWCSFGQLFCVKFFFHSLKTVLNHVTTIKCCLTHFTHSASCKAALRNKSIKQLQSCFTVTIKQEIIEKMFFLKRIKQSLNSAFLSMSIMAHK